MAWQEEEDDIELEGIFKHQTTKAYLIEIDGVDQWIPRSQITGGDFEPERLTPGKALTFFVTAWFADKAGLA